MDKIIVEIVTPNDKKITCETDFVVCKTDEGEIGFLINHTPLIGKISDGFIRYDDKVVVIKNGIIDFKNNLLSCICQDAEIGKDLNDAINNLKIKQDKYLKEAKRKLVDFTEAEKNLAKSIKEASLGKYHK